MRRQRQGQHQQQPGQAAAQAIVDAPPGAPRRKPALQRIRQAAETNQRMPAPRLAEDVVEQQANGKDQQITSKRSRMGGEQMGSNKAPRKEGAVNSTGSHALIPLPPRTFILAFFTV
jgi:hypothetical protein